VHGQGASVNRGTYCPPVLLSGTRRLANSNSYSPSGKSSSSSMTHREYDRQVGRVHSSEYVACCRAFTTHARSRPSPLKTPSNAMVSLVTVIVVAPLTVSAKSLPFGPSICHPSLMQERPPSWLLKEREVSVFDLRNPVRSTRDSAWLSRASAPLHETIPSPPQAKKHRLQALHQSRPISCTCGTHQPVSCGGRRSCDRPSR